MPDSPAADSTKVAAVVPKELKKQLKAFSITRRWTMSQAIAYFIEKGLDEEFDPKQTDN